MSALNMKLEELTSRFVRSLPERVGSITQTWSGIRAETDTATRWQELATRWQELAMRLHALAGTAATYRVHDVAALAQEAERICDLAVAFSPGAAEIEEIGALIGDLQRMVRSQ